MMRSFSTLTGLAVLASRIACVIVIAWFALFAVEQSTGASTHQVNEVASAVSQPQLASEGQKEHAGESGVKQTLDEAAKAITTPFNGILSSSSSEWVKHGEGAFFALVAYGLGVGFLARFVRVRS